MATRGARVGVENTGCRSLCGCGPALWASILRQKAEIPPSPNGHKALRLTCSQMSVRCGTKYTYAAYSDEERREVNR